MWGHAATLVLVAGLLGIGCETPDPTVARDREHEVVPADPAGETQRWAEDDIER